MWYFGLRLWLPEIVGLWGWYNIRFSGLVISWFWLGPVLGWVCGCLRALGFRLCCCGCAVVRWDLVLNSLGLACITGFWDCDFLGWDSFGVRLLVLDLILDFDGVVPGLGSLLSGCWCLFWV